MKNNKRDIPLLIAFSVVAFSEYIQASEGVESMRLFYTAEERMVEEIDNNGKLGSHAKENLSASDVRTVDVLEEVEGSNVVGLSSAAEAYVVFNAIVTLNDQYMVVINDRPCKIERARGAEKQLLVACSQEALSEYILTISAGAAQLNIYHGASKLASLMVGEKL